MNNDTLKLNGKLEQIRRQLKSYGLSLDLNETQQLLDTLFANKEYLQTDETVTSQMVTPNFGVGMIGFMTFDYSYHISISKLTLCAISIFADKITGGLSDKILSVFGVSFKAINPINERNGEKCIVKETILFHNKVGNVKILKQFKGKCCNNDLNCSFKEDGNCKCTEENIKIIYESLVQRDIFKKDGSNYILRW